MNVSQPGRVVIGIGRSAGAYEALRYATAEARTRGVALLAVRAVRAAPSAYGTAPQETLAAAVADVVSAFTEALGAVPTDLTVQVIAQEGVPGVVLTAVADRTTDLLVIGGCTARRFTRPWNATTARDCARRAHCPVVIVPTPALARAGRNRHLARAVARGAEQFLRDLDRQPTTPLPSDPPDAAARPRTDDRHNNPS